MRTSHLPCAYPTLSPHARRYRGAARHLAYSPRAAAERLPQRARHLWHLTLPRRPERRGRDAITGQHSGGLRDVLRGVPGPPDIYRAEADRMATLINAKYWDAQRGLYADDAEKQHYSQHANAMAILAGIAAADKLPHMADAIESDQTLAPASA